MFTLLAIAVVIIVGIFIAIKLNKNAAYTEDDYTANALADQIESGAPTTVEVPAEIQVDANTGNAFTAENVTTDTASEGVTDAPKPPAPGEPICGVKDCPVCPPTPEPEAETAPATEAAPATTSGLDRNLVAASLPEETTVETAVAA